MSVLLFGQVHSLIVALERNNILLIWKLINEHKNLIPCPDSSNLQCEAIFTVLGHLGRKGKSYKHNCDIITFCQFVSKQLPVGTEQHFHLEYSFQFSPHILFEVCFNLLLAHNFVSWFGSEKYWKEFNRTPTNPFSIAIRFSLNIKNCLHDISWKQQTRNVFSCNHPCDTFLWLASILFTTFLWPNYGTWIALSLGGNYSFVW